MISYCVQVWHYQFLTCLKYEIMVKLNLSRTVFFIQRICFKHVCRISSC